MVESLSALLDAAAAARPDHVAVRYGDDARTYAELCVAADGIAATLIDGGVQPGDRVGVHMRKGCDALAAVYGAMKAGAAYVPLDPSAPPKRIAQVIDDCTVSALIIAGARAASVRAELAQVPSLIVVADGAGEMMPGEVAFEDAVRSPAGEQPQIGEDDLAYVLYTSGSTGAPKGVMLSHGNALSFIRWCAERIGIEPDDRLANHAPWHFDLSILDLYLAAFGAATLVIVPEERSALGPDLVEFVATERITHWYSVPSALMLMTTVGGSLDNLDTLRTVIFAGEVYPGAQLHALRAAVPQANLWNLYGPTETNVCTYLEVDALPVEGETLPIGRACENGTELFVVDEAGAEVGFGIEGELWVSGPTVMRGYWGMPERTAASIVPDPRGQGGRCYRTGDIVQWDANGNLRFVGRRDHQIKSRGYRIELGEIEAALASHPLVRESVALALPHEEWGTAVVVCVVPMGGEALRSIDLKRHVADRLPRYMVPIRIDMLEDLPRTPNGKVDRQALTEQATAKPLFGPG